MTTNSIGLSASICRWTARILGTLLLAAVAAIAVGEGLPNPLTQPAIVNLGFAALALVLAGFVVGWRWELAGGILSLVGVFSFWALVIRSLTQKNQGFIWCLAVPGVLYITYCALASCASRRSRA